MDGGLSDMVADGCDGGLRFGESLSGHMLAVPVSPPMEMALAATPGDLKRRGMSGTPSDLPRPGSICGKT